MESLATLPLPVLKLVLSLADDARHDAVTPWEPHVPTLLLERLETSHEPLWGPVIKQLREDLEVAVSITLVRPLAAHPIATLLDGAVWKPVPLRSLRLHFESRPESDNADTDDEPEAEAPDDAMREAWRRMFAKVPQLERLDVHSFRLDSPQLPLVLEAASIECPRLRALVLGTELAEASHDEDAPLAGLRNTLYQGLRRWREATPDGGLQQLEFPLRYAGQEIDEVSRLTALEGEFFAALAQSCPTLEYLNALGAPSVLHTQLLRFKSAICPLAAWQQFTSACTSLVQVDWMHFPYSDEHFARFSAQLRPSVRVLHFNGAEGEHTMSDDGNALYSSAGIAGVLEACRNLRELRIKFDPSLSIPFGSILQPLWNDTVLSAAARCCPRLEVFTLLEYDQPGGAANIPTPLDTITDEGIRILAKLPELRVVKMKATRVTGLGVVELMTHAPTRGAPRKIKLDVGCLLLEGFIDDDEDELVVFYDVVHAVLQQIAQHPDALRGRRCIVNLRNRSRSDSDTPEWRAQLQALIVATASVVTVQVLEEFGRIERVVLRSQTQV